jgi:hypothetical protein
MKINKCLSLKKMSPCRAAVLLIFSGILLWMVGVSAYDNDNIPRTMANGPHRTVNILALKRFFTGPNKDKAFERFDFKRSSKLTGSGVTSGGLEPGLGYAEGEKSGTFLWWIAEGGYSADEPELYASFRHFYDPSQRHGATYLTDHLDLLDKFYRCIAGPVTMAALGKNFNPQVDACSWAIEGEAGGGFGANTYCWNKGLDYMRQAFAETGSGKDRMFVQAWRALGETMHLITDMTSPPHVRDDSHPGMALGMAGFGNYNPNEGMLKADPYESFCRESMVVRASSQPVEEEVASRIAAAAMPRDLFRELATYTQEHFVSSDTIAGTDSHGKAIQPGNELLAYPSPQLKAQDYDAATGYYFQRIGNRSVRLAHETWLSAMGWGTPMQAVRISAPSVQDQADVLIPAAITACAKLLDWFVPRIEIRIDNYNADKKELEGAVNIQSSSAYASPLSYNSNAQQPFYLYMNNSLQNWDKIKLEVKGNRIAVDVSALHLRKDDKVRLDLDIGGMRVRSDDYTIGEEPADILGMYKGTIQTTRINSQYILGRNIKPGNDEITQMLNGATRHENQMTLDDAKWAKIEQVNPFMMMIMHGQNPGEKYHLETGPGSTAYMRMTLPNFWSNTPSKSYGEVQARWQKDHFEVVRSQNGTVYRITGKWNGSQVQGVWSVSEKGNEVYSGVFNAQKSQE